MAHKQQPTRATESQRSILGCAITTGTPQWNALRWHPSKHFPPRTFSPVPLRINPSIILESREPLPRIFCHHLELLLERGTLPLQLPHAQIISGHLLRIRGTYPTQRGADLFARQFLFPQTIEFFVKVEKEMGPVRYN